MHMGKANERQVGGSHYKKAGGEEHWDRAWRLQYDPFQYIITKWVERWRDKGGIEDLEKAKHAIEKYIEVVRAEAQANDGSEPGPSYVNQDRSRKEILRDYVDTARPNSETDTIVCGSCQKIFKGIYAYDMHVCPT
jgi:hypothetical protein